MNKQFAPIFAIVLLFIAMPSFAQRTCSGSASCGFRGQYKRITCGQDCRDLRCPAIQSGAHYVADHAIELLQGWLEQKILVPQTNHTFNATTFIADRRASYSALANQAYDATHCQNIWRDGTCTVVFSCQHGYDTESATCYYSCPLSYCDDVRPAVSAVVDSIFPDFTALMSGGLEVNSNFTGGWGNETRKLCSIGRYAMAAQGYCDARTTSKICDPTTAAASSSLLASLVVPILLLVILS